MKNLTELREELGGLRSQINRQIDGWIDSLDQLAAFMGGGSGKKRKYTKRANGSPDPALRERVKTHFRQQRDSIDVSYKPNPKNVTIPEAAQLTGMTEGGIRYQIGQGNITAMKEIRDTKGPRQGVAYPRAVYVVERKAVEALARAEAAGIPARARTLLRPSQPPPKPSPKPSPAVTRSKQAQQRQRSADYLAKYDENEPRVIPGQQLAPLVRRGYLKRSADGYVRTGKEFVIRDAQGQGVVRPKDVRPKDVASVKAKREATAVLLTKFDREEPRPSSVADKPNMLGVLVTRGYLRKKDGGYIRTAKEFKP